MQSYKIVVNNEQKAKKKITSLRGDKKTHQRTSATSAEKSGNFSAEVWQLLTSSFVARRVADLCACSHLAKWICPLARKDEWGWDFLQVAEKQDCEDAPELVSDYICMRHVLALNGQSVSNALLRAWRSSSVVAQLVTKRQRVWFASRGSHVSKRTPCMSCSICLFVSSTNCWLVLELRRGMPASVKI